MSRVSSPRGGNCARSRCADSLSALFTLLGDGPFQEPKVTDTASMSSLGPFPSSLVQVQWQCWPAAALVRGQAQLNSAWYLCSGNAGHSAAAANSQGFYSCCPEWRKEVHEPPKHKRRGALSVKEWGALGAPSYLKFLHQQEKVVEQSVGLRLVRPGFES